jgi:fatty-acyl-CoA synthase
MSADPYAEAITIGDLLRKATDRDPGNELFVFPHERITYAEFTDRVETLARALRAYGIRAGDHIGILGPNSITYMNILFAAVSIGAVAVPINARFKATELDYIVGHADIKLLFTSDEVSEHVDYPAILGSMVEAAGGLWEKGKLLPDAEHLQEIVLHGQRRDGFLMLDDLLARAGEVPAEEIAIERSRVRLRDVGILMYTSGTTANPKGCMLTHESVVRNGMNFAGTKFMMDSGSRLYDPLPFFHMSVILPLLATISVGGTFISARHFDPVEALDALETERVTIAYPAFENIWQGVLTQPDFADRDLSALKIVMCVGTPERLRKMQASVPEAAMVSAFGCTEGSGTACYNHPRDHLDDRVNTAGTPFPGVQVRVVNEAGEELPAGARGELCFKGYSVFEGYYKDLEKTAEVLTADGWFHTGDLGTVDEKGQVTFQGRIKDMLKIGGENVAALEIEDYLATHPAVHIAAVVAAPDERYTEVSAAYIEVAPGHTLTAEELIDYCRGKIASYKVPRYVRFVEEWPMSGTKIRKYELRERIAAELARERVSA